MDPYLEPFWDLDQVIGWARTRNPEIVRFAAPAKGQETRAIAAQAYESVRRLREMGRDIDHELWEASGWDRERHRKVTYRSPFPPEGHDAARDREPHGPTQVLSFYPFPTEDFVLFLLREGKFTASGSLPGNPLGLHISTVEWAGLELSIDPRDSRLGVFKCISGSQLSAPNADRRLQTAVVENVRVPRKEVLTEFPADPPERTLDQALREAANQSGGKLGQRKAEEIARDAGAYRNREEVREALRRLKIEGKQGRKRKTL